MKRIIAITVLISLACMPVSFAQSATKKNSSLSKTLAKVKQKKAVIQSQLRSKKAETNKMMSEIHAVDDKMDSLESKIEASTKELSKAKVEQGQLAEDLRAKTAEFDAVRVDVRKRLRAIYAQGESSSISILVGTSSIGDLASRKALVERVAEKDRELFTKVRVMRDMILAKKKEQDRIVAKVAELRTQHEQSLIELEDVRKKKKSIFSILAAQKGQLEDQLAIMEQESRKLESQIFQYQNKNGGSTVAFNGKFIRPVNGRQSSAYGMRVHPISGSRRMHTGLDIAAKSGTGIKAAAAGTVITASYIRGYGNTVVIDHGGKVSTLYGHCSKLYVKVGQSVKQGEVVAAVGSTGNSTGPHLHWEVRINGKPVNPSGKY